MTSSTVGLDQFGGRFGGRFGDRSAGRAGGRYRDRAGHVVRLRPLEGARCPQGTPTVRPRGARVGVLPEPVTPGTARTAAGRKAATRRARRDGRRRPSPGSIPQAFRPVGVRSAGSARVATVAPVSRWCAVATLLVFAVVAVVLVRTVSAQAPADGGALVTVSSGDTLWSIAQRDLPQLDPRDAVLQIEGLNGLGSDAVSAGQVLRLPAAVDARG